MMLKKAYPKVFLDESLSVGQSVTIVLAMVKMKNL